MAVAETAGAVLVRGCGCGGNGGRGASARLRPAFGPVVFLVGAVALPGTREYFF